MLSTFRFLLECRRGVSSFNFRNRFILVRVTVELELIPGTPGALDGRRTQAQNENEKLNKIKVLLDITEIDYHFGLH